MRIDISPKVADRLWKVGIGLAGVAIIWAFAVFVVLHGEPYLHARTACIGETVEGVGLVRKARLAYTRGFRAKRGHAHLTLVLAGDEGAMRVKVYLEREQGHWRIASTQPDIGVNGM